MSTSCVVVALCSTHASDEQCRAIAIGDGWSRTRHSPARILIGVPLEPNVSHRRGQPATITAKKTRDLAVRRHDVVRIASRDRTGILCPRLVDPGVGARWGRRVSLAGGRRLFERQFFDLAADNSHRRVKRLSFRTPGKPRRIRPLNGAVNSSETKQILFHSR